MLAGSKRTGKLKQIEADNLSITHVDQLVGMRRPSLSRLRRRYPAYTHRRQGMRSLSRLRRYPAFGIRIVARKPSAHRLDGSLPPPPHIISTAREEAIAQYPRAGGTARARLVRAAHISKW